MLTIASEFQTSSNDTMYITQFVENEPISHGSVIAPQSMTTLWEVRETVDGWVAEAVQMHRVQSGTASRCTDNSRKPVPEEHVTELKARLVTNLPIKSSSEVTFYKLNGDRIDNKNKTTTTQ